MTNVRPPMGMVISLMFLLYAGMQLYAVAKASAGLALAFALTGGLIIDLMATAPDVRAVARDYLPYMIATPLAGCAAWMFDGIFIGATRSRDMRNMMAVSFLIYCLAAALLVPWLGNHGLWLALLVSFVARGVTLGLRYPALERQANARGSGEPVEKPGPA